MSYLGLQTREKNGKEKKRKKEKQSQGMEFLYGYMTFA